MFVLTMLNIQGPCRLEGTAKVQGAKNSALPLLAASLLCRGESVFHNCPCLSDVETSAEILRHLGCRVRREDDALVVDASSVDRWDIPDGLMRKMRSSIVFLGAILGRVGKAELSYPGGCELGPRPIDLHLRAMEKLGAQVRERHGRLFCERKGALAGSEITLTFPSVGATENILLSAVTAEGITVVHNAAKEPEIGDLIAFLNGCGGDIREDGAGTLAIRGVPRLNGCEHTILPDRIAAATLLSAAAATGGRMTLERVRPEHFRPVLQTLEQSGCLLRTRKGSIDLAAPERLRAAETIRTMPYPGFPTDAQPPVMAALLRAKGADVFVENIFESRGRTGRRGAGRSPAVRQQGRSAGSAGSGGAGHRRPYGGGHYGAAGCCLPGSGIRSFGKYPERTGRRCPSGGGAGFKEVKQMQIPMGNRGFCMGICIGKEACNGSGTEKYRTKTGAEQPV